MVVSTNLSLKRSKGAFKRSFFVFSFDINSEQQLNSEGEVFHPQV
ncbi:hypothetical protein PROPEN_01563 [Proteus penneri ATCC 35198]|nr:hypothetical protein PROPEN_01563 [Proteus penneri ATCC 35198]